jgi:hypothetical protein
MRKTLSVGLLVLVAGIFFAPTSSATIHPIVQSIACAADAARANVAVADPPGQTPTGFTTEIMSVSGTILRVGFPEPLSFSQSDFRALQATGFIDALETNADGQVTAVLVDLTSIPRAASGQGGAHCAAG